MKKKNVSIKLEWKVDRKNVEYSNITNIKGKNVEEKMSKKTYRNGKWSKRALEKFE